MNTTHGRGAGCIGMLCTASLLAPAAPAAAAEDARHPNLIVIIADDLPRELSTYLPEGEGNALMPTLDRLAREGAVLANMRSPSAVCTPSRFALLTGTYPSRCAHPWFESETRQHGQPVVQFNTHIVPGQETVAAWLSDAGYATGAVGKNHVISAPGYQRLPYGADPNDPQVATRLQRNAEAVEQAFLNAGFDSADALYHGNPDADGIRALAVHNQEWLTDAAIRFIDRNADEPFFLLMSTTLTHGPYAPQRGYKADPLITAEGFLDTPLDVQAPRDTIDPRLQQAGVSGFNTGSVLWLDDAVDALMHRLASHEIDDNTIMLFLSDHGMGAKGTCYEAAVRTSAFAWQKGGFGGPSVITADLSLVDIAPTLLDLAGADLSPEDFDGQSFTTVLDGTTDAVRDYVYSEIGFSRAIMRDGMKYLALRYPEHVVNMSPDERRERLESSNARLRERGIELITEDPSAPFSHLFIIPGGHDTDRKAVSVYPAYHDANQLYDLRRDPGEQHNLANDPAYADTLAELKALLDRKVTELPGTFGEFGHAAQDASQTP
ncbi:MAG: sulfatase-like hydrolase/transferase [Planctomycetota bacterium]